MHDDLWASVDSALGGAQFHLNEASRSLQPPERTAMRVVLESSAGTIVWKPWEEPFYNNVRSFLQQARSVPFVIESCFGRDIGLEELKAWFIALTEDEQARRREFHKLFESHRDQFREHYLTKAANIAVHRRGFAPVEGVVIGPTGKPYPASPITSVPVAESPLFGDEAPLWARTQPSIPVRPSDNASSLGPNFSKNECHADLDALANGRTRRPEEEVLRRLHRYRRRATTRSAAVGSVQDAAQSVPIDAVIPTEGRVL